MKTSILLVVLIFWCSCTEDNLQLGIDGEPGSQSLQQTPFQESTPAPSLLSADGSLREKLLTYEQRQGKHVYIKYCAVCHGEQGEGDGFNAYNLDPGPRDFTETAYMSALSDARLAETISQGGRGVNRSVAMPSWGGRLSGEEIEFVVFYIRLFSETNDEEKR